MLGGKPDASRHSSTGIDGGNSDKLQAPKLTLETVVSELRKRDFGVLSTVDPDGKPHSAGVNYGVFLTQGKLSLYVMTRRHLKKARNIAGNPHVAFVAPLTRRVLWFLPPASISFQGTAEILDWKDEESTKVFESFFMGRQILRKYEEANRRGETRICSLRITPESEISTYMVGYPVWEMSKRMESGQATVVVGP